MGPFRESVHRDQIATRMLEMVPVVLIGFYMTSVDRVVLETLNTAQEPPCRPVSV
jgi:hypothetical protein